MSKFFDAEENSTNKKDKVIVIRMNKKNYDYMIQQAREEGYDNLSSYGRHIWFKYFRARQSLIKGNKAVKDNHLTIDRSAQGNVARFWRISPSSLNNYMLA